MVIYFSGTGNSRFVADALGARLADTVVSANAYIKSEKKGIFESETPYVFVFPIYVSTIAEVFANFLRESEFSGNKNAYFVATCAGANGSAPIDSEKICREKGLNYMGSEMVVMPQNYIAHFHMTDSEEIARRQANADRKAEEISKKILAGECLDMTFVSKVEYAATIAVERLYNKYFTRAKKFYATDKCVGCHLCEKVCPLNNIHLTETDHRPQWGGECVHCMACINRCPKDAIEYGKGTANKKRYVCPPYSTSSKQD